MTILERPSILFSLLAPASYVCFSQSRVAYFVCSFCTNQPVPSTKILVSTKRHHFCLLREIIQYGHLLGNSPSGHHRQYLHNSCHPGDSGRSVDCHRVVCIFVLIFSEQVGLCVAARFKDVLERDAATTALLTVGRISFWKLCSGLRRSTATASSISSDIGGWQRAYIFTEKFNARKIVLGKIET